jgi:hypothetical protein
MFLMKYLRTKACGEANAPTYGGNQKSPHESLCLWICLRACTACIEQLTHRNAYPAFSANPLP